MAIRGSPCSVADTLARFYSGFSPRNLKVVIVHFGSRFFGVSPLYLEEGAFALVAEIRQASDVAPVAGRN